MAAFLSQAMISPGALPRARLAPPLPGLVNHVDLLGKSKCGSRQGAAEGERQMLFTQNHHCFSLGGQAPV